MANTVFICGDTGQVRLLEEVERTLAADGCRIVHGPINEVGVLKRYSADDCSRLLHDADVAVFTIRHDCSRAVLESGPRLRGVCYPTIGVESADVAAATELGVAVGHAATAGNVIGMAEATIMLALTLLYGLHDAERRMRNNVGKPPIPNAHCLFGKTVGFLGFGRIARAMAERLAPFGTPMLTCSPRMRPETLPAGVAKVDLETLMRASDVLCVLVSITPESRGLLSMRELSLMKPTAYLINTGRGEAMDEAALHQVLKERRIAGAALDTFAAEPLPSDSPLRALDNVILTPHMVGQTREAFDELAPVMVENIRLLLRGELPLYCKNPEVGERWQRRWGASA